jgi:hypothetical protein
MFDKPEEMERIYKLLHFLLFDNTMIKFNLFSLDFTVKNNMHDNIRILNEMCYDKLNSLKQASKKFKLTYTGANILEQFASQWNSSIQTVSTNLNCFIHDMGVIPSEKYLHLPPISRKFSERISRIFKNYNSMLTKPLIYFYFSRLKIGYHNCNCEIIFHVFCMHIVLVTRQFDVNRLTANLTIEELNDLIKSQLEKNVLIACCEKHKFGTYLKFFIDLLDSLKENTISTSTATNILKLEGIRQPAEPIVQATIDEPLAKEASPSVEPPVQNGTPQSKALSIDEKQLSEAEPPAEEPPVEEPAAEEPPTVVSEEPPAEKEPPTEEPTIAESEPEVVVKELAAEPAPEPAEAEKPEPAPEQAEAAPEVEVEAEAVAEVEEPEPEPATEAEAEPGVVSEVEPEPEAERKQIPETEIESESINDEVFGVISFAVNDAVSASTKPLLKESLTCSLPSIPPPKESLTCSLPSILPPKESLTYSLPPMVFNLGVVDFTNIPNFPDMGSLALSTTGGERIVVEDNELLENKTSTLIPKSRKESKSSSESKSKTRAEASSEVRSERESALSLGPTLEPEPKSSFAKLTSTELKPEPKPTQEPIPESKSVPAESATEKSSTERKSVNDNYITIGKSKQQIEEEQYMIIKKKQNAKIILITSSIMFFSISIAVTVIWLCSTHTSLNNINISQSLPIIIGTALLIIIIIVLKIVLNCYNDQIRVDKIKIQNMIVDESATNSR